MSAKHRFARVLSCVMLLLTQGIAPLAHAAEELPTAKVIAPEQVLDLPLAALEERKGAGARAYGMSAEGKTLSHVAYAETWFGLPDPVRAQYLVRDLPGQTLQQITLGFKDEVKREAIVAAAEKVLGPAAQGESDPDAPSKYFAQWIKGAVRYDLQDYGDYREMYIAWARFSWPEKHKLPDPLFIVEQQDTSVAGKPDARRVMLLGEKPAAAAVSPPYAALWLYFCDAREEAKGKAVALPPAAYAELYTKPDLTTLGKDTLERLAKEAE